MGTDGLTALLKEMREAMPDMYISVASQAAEANWINSGVGPNQAQYLDHYHIMNYDYTVSDIADKQPLSPNQPLYNPPEPVQQWSINYTVQGYLAAGVPAEKMMIGLAMYGHTWYKPDFDDWQTFGADPDMQGSCYGPFKDTYGGAPGVGSRQCGTLMLSEIEAAIDGGCETFHETVTQTDIAYCKTGTWVTCQGQETTEAVVDYGKKLGVGGFSTWDTSMDSLNPQYKLHNAIVNRMGGDSPSPSPSPTPPAPSPPAPSPPTPPPAPTPPAPPPPAPTPSGCHSISATVPDEWRDSNCHHIPSNCPESLCSDECRSSAPALV